VPDDYLSGLSTETTITAAELCAVGLWERVEGGYRVIDWEAVEICLDHVREPGGEDPLAHAWEQEREAQVRSVAFSISRTSAMSAGERAGPDGLPRYFQTRT
jgi:hypothetical protein